MPDTGLSVDLRRDFAGFVELTLEKPTPEGRRFFVLTANEIDGDAESFFGRGYCHWLAAAIHSATGWDLVTVDALRPDGQWKPAHTAVVTPAGTLLDIFGERPAEQVRRTYMRGDYTDTRLRSVEAANMPGDVLTDIDDLRGDPLWWTNVFSTPEFQGVLLHFARLLLRRHGYGEHLDEAATERPGQAAKHTTTTTTRTPTSPPVPGGRETGMSSVDEVRAALANSNSKAEGLQGLLAQATQELGEIVAGVAQATSGSQHTAIQEATGIYAQIGTQIEQAMGMVSVAVNAVTTYTGSL